MVGRDFELIFCTPGERCTILLVNLRLVAMMIVEFKEFRPLVDVVLSEATDSVKLTNLDRVPVEARKHLTTRAHSVFVEAIAYEQGHSNGNR